MATTVDRGLMRKIFVAGIFLMVAGSAWIVSTHLGSTRESTSSNIEPDGTFTFGIELEGSGIAYYMIEIEDFANQKIESEVLDGWGNRIWGRHIDTKMMINYFRFNETGKYWIKVDNLSGRNVAINVEVGDTSSDRMVAPWVVMLAGLGTVIASVYMGTVFRISSSQRRRAGRRAGRAR